MERSSRRRRALSTALAVLLAVESVSVVAATAQVAGSRQGTPADAVAGTPDAVAGTPAAVAILPAEAAPATAGRSTAIAGAGVADYGMPDPAPAAPAAVPAAPDRPQASRAEVTNVAKAVKATKTNPKPAPVSPASYRGRNHVWIPSLGINRSVHWFSCDRSRDPDNYVYRWGCAGDNNVYLLGHAHSVFKGLHDSYVSGRLHKGMKAYYADAKGRVHVYAVRWWRVTAPTTAASWAWASLGSPSMTLQTCVGRNSQYRLIVRLVEVDG
ncbi:MAG: sortase [Chloroflexota bacterium]